ncbi:MAG TPA: alpha-amylase family glycosyl hydrolase [Polyangia bacterium]|nr:alpha-amylase family glycosyl hydrolase [Polyangia bacterium]
MPATRFPLLYQLNTRVLVAESRAGGTLDDLPDALLDQAATRGFAWIWALGVWQTGPAGLREALAPGLRPGYARDLPDVRDADIIGSPFAVRGYDVHRDLGGDAALARLRERLRVRGLRLMLDFVPNHVALDHPWVDTHPQYFIHGTEDDLRREPGNYVRLNDQLILAHGRDPYFPGWTDTLQLDYRLPALREAMTGELLRVAARCDGVRCDMAMLLEPDVISRTWPRPDPAVAPFWPDAIARVRRQHPGFLFLAEAYWDLEWRMMQHGFDFAYDKRLYDRLRAGVAGPVRDHLAAEPAFRDRCARFLENHDEPRAAATFPPERHRAAAVLAFLVPGLRLFHEGQLEGRRAHAAIQLARRATEAPDQALRAFYDRLLAVLRRDEPHDGDWHLCEVAPLENDAASQNVIAFWWELGSSRLVGAVNFGDGPARCRIAPRFTAGGNFRIVQDLLGDTPDGRSPVQPDAGGISLNLAAWDHHLYEVRDAAS